MAEWANSNGRDWLTRPHVNPGDPRVRLTPRSRERRLARAAQGGVTLRREQREPGADVTALGIDDPLYKVGTLQLHVRGLTLCGPDLSLHPNTSLSLHLAQAAMVLSFILIQNRQGKTRLAKWYAPYTDEEKVKLKGEVCHDCLQCFTNALSK